MDHHPDDSVHVQKGRPPGPGFLLIPALLKCGPLATAAADEGTTSICVPASRWLPRGRPPERSEQGIEEKNPTALQGL